MTGSVSSAATVKAKSMPVPGRTLRPDSYQLHVLSELGGPVKSSSGLIVSTERMGSARFDTLIAVGGLGAFRASSSPALQAFVRRAAKSSRRISSVCSGTVILAAAGLLDGLRATTHWQSATFLQRKYPKIRVESDRI